MLGAGRATERAVDVRNICRKLNLEVMRASEKSPKLTANALMPLLWSVCRCLPHWWWHRFHAQLPTTAHPVSPSPFTTTTLHSWCMAVSLLLVLSLLYQHTVGDHNHCSWTYKDCCYGWSSLQESTAPWLNPQQEHFLESGMFVLVEQVARASHQLSPVALAVHHLTTCWDIDFTWGLPKALSLWHCAHGCWSMPMGSWYQ